MKNYLPLQRFLSKELAEVILEAMGGDLSDYTVTFAPRKPESVCVYGFDQAKILFVKCSDVGYIYFVWYYNCFVG